MIELVTSEKSMLESWLDGLLEIQRTRYFTPDIYHLHIDDKTIYVKGVFKIADVLRCPVMLDETSGFADTFYIMYNGYKIVELGSEVKKYDGE